MFRTPPIALGHPGRVRVALLLLLGACSASGVADRAAAEETIRVGRYSVTRVTDGSSAKKSQRIATGNIPWKQLQPQQVGEVSRIVRGSTLFRRMPTFATQVEPEIYDFFVGQPETAVSLWRAMGISKFQLQPTREGEYAADSGDGSVGVIKILLRTKESVVMVLYGKLASPLLTGPVDVSAVVHLRTAWYKDRQGDPLVSHRADLFVQFGSGFASTAARLLAPMGRSMIDRNFQEITLFGNVISGAMKRRPEWVLKHVDKMDGVSAAQLDYLTRLTKALHQVASAKDAPEGRASAAPNQSPRGSEVPVRSASVVLPRPE